MEIEDKLQALREQYKLAKTETDKKIIIQRARAIKIAQKQAELEQNIIKELL